VQEIEELKRQGLSIKAISNLTRYDRKTIRKYMRKPKTVPVYGLREGRSSKLDPFKSYIERLNVGVWNGRVLLRELRSQGYWGGQAIAVDAIANLRQHFAESDHSVVFRFVTNPAPFRMVAILFTIFDIASDGLQMELGKRSDDDRHR
jgi:transposase